MGGEKISPYLSSMVADIITVLLVKAGDGASLGDGLVAHVDVDAEEDTNGIKTVAHIVVHLFLERERERERERGGGKC